MKYRYLSIVCVLFVAFMFLAGCGQQPVEAPQPVPKETVKEPVRAAPEPEPEKEETPEPEREETPEPARVNSKKVQQVLDKNVGRVTSIKYMYQDQTIKPEEWETWVTKDKMHVKLREVDEISGDVYVDNVYLDLRTRKAVGFCERKAYICADPNTPVDVNFNKYYRETPWEWIEKIGYAEHEGTEQMQMRTMHKLVSQDGDETVTMWVDDYYGLPTMVRVVKNSVRNDYVYEDISFNTVDDSDLVHQAVTVAYRE